MTFAGAMDSQDIVIWGKVRPDMTVNDLVRIRELCKWGEQYKLDGFVRYWFNCFPRLALSLMGPFLQDGLGLVSIILLVDLSGWLIYGVWSWVAKS